MKLSNPIAATVAPSLESAGLVGKSLGDTLRASHDVKQSIASHARYAASLLKFANGSELLAEYLYCADVRLFTGVGKKSENRDDYATWRNLTNQIRTIAEDMGYAVKVTCPGGVYNVAVTAAKKKAKAKSGAPSRSEQNRGSADDTKQDIETLQRIARAAVESGAYTEAQVIDAVLTAFHTTKRGRQSAAKAAAKRA